MGIPVAFNNLPNEIQIRKDKCFVDVKAECNDILSILSR